VSVTGLSPNSAEPAYLALFRSGELASRVPLALAGLACCALCPRGCRVDRVHGSRLGLCRVGRLAQGVTAARPPTGLPDCGQIVFAGGGLRSVFESPLDHALELAPQALADQMLALQAAGCRALDLVNAGHVVPQVLEALLLAVQRGLRLPLIYSTAAYDGPLALRLLDGVVDVYRPLFQLWGPQLGLRYLRARNYPLAARRAIRAMHQQVGDLRLDAQGHPLRGLWLRHPILPAGAAGTRPLLRWVVRQVSPRTAVEIFPQPLFTPCALARFPELAAPFAPTELAAARAIAQSFGLRLLPRP
jgi:putative pyruvate formate lyase activating enzyme